MGSEKKTKNVHCNARGTRSFLNIHNSCSSFFKVQGATKKGGKRLMSYKKCNRASESKHSVV